MTRDEIKNTPEIVDYVLSESLMAESKEKLHKRLDEICNLAIEALEKEPCEDCVSRDMVHEMLENVPINPNDKWFNWLQKACLRLAELPSVQPKTEWIPVSERLPDDEQEILFSTKTGRIHSGKYHDDDSANKWYSHKDKCRAWNNVVNAWMPLPEPYKMSEIPTGSEGEGLYDGRGN